LKIDRITIIGKMVNCCSFSFKEEEKTDIFLEKRFFLSIDVIFFDFQLNNNN